MRYEINRGGVDAIRRNDVIRKRRSFRIRLSDRARIDRAGYAYTGAITEVGVPGRVHIGTFLVGENGACGRRGVLPLAGALVVAENECLVLLDWATDGTAKLVQFEGWLLGPGDIEEVVGVEYVIAQELEGVPVPLVCSGL